MCLIFDFPHLQCNENKVSAKVDGMQCADRVVSLRACGKHTNSILVIRHHIAKHYPIVKVGASYLFIREFAIFQKYVPSKQYQSKTIRGTKYYNRYQSI